MLSRETLKNVGGISIPEKVGWMICWGLERGKNVFKGLVCKIESYLMVRKCIALLILILFF